MHGPLSCSRCSSPAHCVPSCNHCLQEKLLSERNSIIAANNNRHARERAALERQQEKLQVEAAFFATSPG